MKRFFTALLAVLTIVSLALPGSAADEQTIVADTLYTLDLIEGTGSGYELDRAPTRLEALVFTLRLSGLEDDAQVAGGHAPFVDVPDWATKYVCYAYDSGLIKGIDELHFGSNLLVRDKDFFYAYSSNAWIF